MRPPILPLIFSTLLPGRIVCGQAAALPAPSAPLPAPIQAITPGPAASLAPAAGPVAKSAHFTLELYYENDADRPFAQQEADRLIAMVGSLAPHIDLQVLVLPATAITRTTFSYNGVSHNVPNQAPSQPDRQALLITDEDIGAEGWAGKRQGCLCKQKLEDKLQQGGNSADITVHEWLHTIEGLEINGRPIPNPHTNAAYGFPLPTERSPQGFYTWHEWYRFMLRDH